MKENGNQVIFKKGEVIFRQGDFEIFMYDILKGVVDIYSDYGETTQKKLTTLYDGEFFGEMGLVQSMPRSATAVAKEETITNKIDHVGFGEYFKDKPSEVIAILQHMSSRMRDLTHDYMEACHTIDEYLALEEKNEPKPQSLIDRMKKFVNVYRKSQK